MLNKQYYSFEELENIINVQFTKKNNRVKLLKRNIEPYYEFEIVKEGRAQIGLNILSYKELEKSRFIKLCEQIAEKEVKFPKEETAEKLIKVLLEDDYTINNYDDIGWEVPGRLERHTVSDYIELFREYNILPKKLDKIERHSFDAETGELFSKSIDPNKYTYYKVYTVIDLREEITKEEWLEMHEFIKEIYEENVNNQLELCKGDAEAIKEVMRFASAEAHKACAYEYGGVPRKSISKALTKEAYKLFLQYFKKEDETFGVVKKYYNADEAKEREQERSFWNHPSHSLPTGWAWKVEEQVKNFTGAVVVKYNDEAKRMVAVNDGEIINFDVLKGTRYKTPAEAVWIMAQSKDEYDIKILEVFV